MTAEQEELVVSHMRIVPPIAKRLVKKFGLPFWIDIDEMISCGYIGLCKAALAFDPERGRFETYATFRIRGTIIDDFLRRQAPVMVQMHEDAYEYHGECEEHDNQPEDPSASIETLLIEEQERQRRCQHLSFAFAHLGETEVRVLKKKYLAGQTLQQICEAEDPSTGWVHCRVQRGKQKLKEALLATCAE
jgi:RNA polymerase sigma factor (sigma-70 family)